MINARSNQTLLNPDHVDGIQGQVTGNPAVAQIKNLTYRRNIVDIGNGHNSQIFFVAHEAFRNGVTTNAADAHQNFIVEDNLGISRTTHGISMSSVNNGTLQRNAVFRAPAINPDTFIGNDLTNNGVTVPDLRMTAEAGFGCTGVWTVKDNFAGAQAGSPAGATILNNLYQDPSITPFDTLYAALVTGFSSVYDASGAPFDQNHLNVIWPKAGGALATGLIGPTWWHNGSFAGWGPYNTGVQPAKPGDTSLWGRVALLGGSTAPPIWTPSSATINVQVN